MRGETSARPAKKGWRKRKFKPNKKHKCTLCIYIADAVRRNPNLVIRRVISKDWMVTIDFLVGDVWRTLREQFPELEEDVAKYHSLGGISVMVEPEFRIYRVEAHVPTFTLKEEDFYVVPAKMTRTITHIHEGLPRLHHINVTWENPDFGKLVKFIREW